MEGEKRPLALDWCEWIRAAYRERGGGEKGGESETEMEKVRKTWRGKEE